MRHDRRSEDSERRDIARTVLWQRRDVPGLEHATLLQDGHEVWLEGTVVASVNETPLRVEYSVLCGPDWATRTVRVASTFATAARELVLTRDRAGRWWRDNEEVSAIAGCVDVDLSVTPSTNTLPIRRLGLAPGDGRDVTAAWIRIPELAIEPLPQRYVRIGERRYRYESRGGAFVAELDVDDEGIVIDYPPAWTRIAASRLER